MRRIGMMLLMLMTYFNSSACEICGASVNSSYQGLMPEFKKYYFGLRHQQNRMQYHRGQGGINSYLSSTETVNAAEVWASFAITEKWRFTTSIPYRFITRKSASEKQTSAGIGDASLLALYRLMNKNSSGSKTSQTIWIAAGLKVPTGKFQHELHDAGLTQAGFQLGSGSLDFLAQAFYNWQLSNTGFQFSAAYKFNTSNADAYQFGNAFSAQALGYYRISISKKWQLLPMAGLIFELNAKDKKAKSLRVWETGGESLFGHFGAESRWGKWTTSLSFQQPIWQFLGEGKLKGYGRTVLGIGYFLN